MKAEVAKLTPQPELALVDELFDLPPAIETKDESVLARDAASAKAKARKAKNAA